MIPTLAFFNNKGGVGKTTLAFHLAFMLARVGRRVLAVDLDPQGNLTSAFLDDEALDALWENDGPTVMTSLGPFIEREGAIKVVDPVAVADDLGLLPGSLSLSTFEDQLAQDWLNAQGGLNVGFKATSAFFTMIQGTAQQWGADVVLVDVGPNLGPINRAALLATSHIVVPLGADLFSLQGMRNFGPVVRRWRRDWQRALDSFAMDGGDTSGFTPGKPETLGYVVMQHAIRLDRPVKAFQPWIDRIRPEFYHSVLGLSRSEAPAPGQADSYELANLRNYRSLMPLAQAARKPMFDLRSADGALGSTLTFVRQCEADFRALALEVSQRVPAGAVR